MFFLLNGCGYRPSVSYAKEQISGKVFYELDIDIKNLEYSVLIRDAILELLIRDLDAKIVDDKASADTFVKVSLSSVSHTALRTDSAGYTNLYRTTVNISFSYNKKDERTKTVTMSDYYDYAVDSNSSLTEDKKLEAIKIAAVNALTNNLSKIGIQSFKK